MTASEFLKKTIDVESRQFAVHMIRFENGNFVSITEGKTRIGSMVVSLSSGPKPVTTTVIPTKTDSSFIKLVAEKISSTVYGIAIVSVNVKNELDTNSTKAIMGTITEMIRNV